MITHADETPHGWRCYVPSGRVSWKAPVQVALIGLPTSLVLGWLYALVQFHSPLILASLFIWAVFCAGLTVMAGMVLEAGHSRSPPFNVAATAVMAFAGWWAHWIVMLKQHGPADSAAVEFAMSGPPTWLHLAGVLAARLHEQNPRVDGLLLAWGPEALTVIGLPMLLVWMSPMPYSEAKKTWAKKDASGELWLFEESADELRTRLQTEGVEALRTLAPASHLEVSLAAAKWQTVVVDGTKVDADPAARWLTVTFARHVRQDNGRVKTQRESVVTAWQVSDADYRAVMAHMASGADAGIDTSRDARDAAENDEARARLEAPPTPPQLVGALEAFEASRYDDALAIALPFAGIGGAANLACRTDANRLCALALSQQNKFAEALSFWKVLNDLEPTAHNLLQVACASAVAGDIANAERWFDDAMARAHATQVRGERPQAPQMIANFTTALFRGGAQRAAFARLELLADLYAGMHITDTTFLWMRGMPFFETFVEQAAPIVRSVAGRVDLEAWYTRLHAAVDEPGQRLLEAARPGWRLDGN